MTFADLGQLAVDLNGFRVFRIKVHIREIRTDQTQNVTVGNGILPRFAAQKAQATNTSFVVIVDPILGAQRSHDGGVDPLGKFNHIIGGIGRTNARQNDRIYRAI